jgi:spermidine/putrescine transport system substrate-binding protein
VWLLYEMDFVVPEGGALLWIDNMMIPAGAQNPVGAMEVMDFYYDPKVATMVAEWVLYMTPVKGVADLIAKDADQAVEDGYKGYANKLYQTAQSDYLFPDDEFIAQTSFGFDPKTDEEMEEWDSIFLPISQG